MENNSNNQDGMKNKISWFRKYKFLIYVLGIILLSAIGYFIYVYIQIQRGEYVKWNGIWYTKEELKEKYPPQYVETPAKNNPEEVYAIFRQALLDGNLELALEQITEQERKEYKEILNVDGAMKKWGDELPHKIILEKISGNDAYYNLITFSKDYTGYWKIRIIWL